MKCIDDEIPFEIPSSWEWVRLGSIVDFSKSNSIKTDTLSNDTWILDLEDIEKETSKLLAKKFKREVNAKSDKHVFYKGNVLYSKLRPYLNKVIIADEDGVCTSEILAFDFGLIYNKYAKIFLMSPFFVDYAMSDAYGVKMPRLGSKQGNNALMPIPPTKEQKRIISQIESLIPKIIVYEKAQSELNDLNTSIKERLKKSILQDAIQGKFVAQDPNDEPASMLLERIRVEKERLIKEKKIKRDKNESIIYKGDDNLYYERIGSKKVEITNNIPFDLPKAWEWVRFGNIVKMNIGKTPSRSDIRFWSNGIYPWVSISDMKTYSRISDTKENISSIAANIMGEISHKGSLLMSFKLTVGRTSILNIDAYHNEAIISIYTYVDENQFIRDYLFYILPILSNLGDSKNAIKGKTLNSKSLYSLLIPLPPIEEQHRIVGAIANVFNKIKG